MQVKTKGNLKLIQSKETVTCNVAQIQPVIISSFQIGTQSSTPRS
jgi:hypothetical protein